MAKLKRNLALLMCVYVCVCVLLHQQRGHHRAARGEDVVARVF